MEDMASSWSTYNQASLQYRLEELRPTLDHSLDAQSKLLILILKLLGATCCVFELFDI